MLAGGRRVFTDVAVEAVRPHLRGCYERREHPELDPWTAYNSCR